MLLYFIGQSVIPHKKIDLGARLDSIRFWDSCQTMLNFMPLLSAYCIAVGSLSVTAELVGLALSLIHVSHGWVGCQRLQLTAVKSMSVTAELVVSAFSRCWVWKQIKIIIIFEYFLLYKKYKLIDLLNAYLGTTVVR